MNKRLKHSLIAGGLVVALSATGGTVWALERFVVPHVVVDDVAAYEAAQNPTASATESATTSAPAEVTDTTYTSDDASIEITTHTQGTGDDTVTYYVADVELGDATRLRSAFAQNQFGENITDLVSSIATDNGAVFAVNGDYYGFRDSGIVIRNGVVYRDQGAREGLVFYEDGSVAVYDETETTAAELLADGAWNTLSFGPAIVEDGAVVAGIDDVEIDTNIGNHSIQGEQPRTAIGVIDDNHLMIVVVDGRDTGYSRGVTMTELADIMVSLGATTAYNLDGGGSSEMWFNGEVVNQPSNGGERATSDILYLAG
ncbi:MAG: phosphodiester glycosidase family protein [Candidatus Microbacterium phytovorans]|uniref:Phosphodiester glycosidase family protein n=1 Tax=Candidatus Microbacterium phytovorans TaxID=3121374 RepID=A0AAJ5W0W2_9MICO|nr:phosphodiester glycosidase family protein [Microbacterium sp.]WEK13510.1 MAG: phosphodiester glycosidase family protein [Microbacterium sp.]